MIKIVRKPMSEEVRARYDELVRRPGQRWLEAHPVTENLHDSTRTKARPRPYWRKIHSDIAEAFHMRCAYTAMGLKFNGEVDHAISIDEDRSKAYDWDNFRYCVAWFNSKKQAISSNKILDPLLVEDDWFELSWPDLQLHVTDRCPAHLRAQAEFMLEELELRCGEKIMRNREAYVALYEEQREAALPFIDREAPLVARAIRKELIQGSEVPSQQE